MMMMMMMMTLALWLGSIMVRVTELLSCACVDQIHVKTWTAASRCVSWSREGGRCADAEPSTAPRSMNRCAAVTVRPTSTSAEWRARRAPSVPTSSSSDVAIAPTVKTVAMRKTKFFERKKVSNSSNILCQTFAAEATKELATLKALCLRSIDPGGWGLDLLKICSRCQSMFWPPKISHFTWQICGRRWWAPGLSSMQLSVVDDIFHSKLLLDNSASFTSSKMKDVSKMEGRLIFRGAFRLSRTGIVEHKLLTYGVIWNRAFLKEIFRTAQPESRPERPRAGGGVLPSRNWIWCILAEKKLASGDYKTQINAA